MIDKHSKKRNWVKVILVGMLITMALGNVMAQSSSSLKTIIIDPGHGGVDGGASGKYSREAIVALEIGLKVKTLMTEQVPDIKVLLTRDRDVLPGGGNNRNAALRWRANFANSNAGNLFISIHLNASPANNRWGRKQVGTRQETYYVYSGKGKKKKKTAKTRTVPVYERFKIEPNVFGTQTYVLASDYYKGKVAAVGHSAVLKDTLVYADSVDAELMEMDPVEARIKAQQYTKYFFQKSLTLANYMEEEFAGIGRYSWGVWQRDWKGADGIWVLQATEMPSILIESGFIDHPDDENYLNSEEGRNAMAQSIVNAIKRYRDILDHPEKLSATNK